MWSCPSCGSNRCTSETRQCPDCGDRWQQLPALVRKPGDFETAWAKYVAPECIIVMQHIEVSWTKQSRGGNGATARNAVPESQPLPNSADGSKRLILHRVEHCESEEFELRERIEFPDYFVDLQRNGALMIPEEGQLTVLKEREDGIHRYGDPPLKRAFSLEPGQWGRLSYNTRLSGIDCGNWWYEKHVFNIGVFRELATGVFCDTESDFEFSRMEKLF